MTKICKTCGDEKPDEDFYTNDKTCKPCRCAKNRANREAKIDQYQAYDKARNMRPDRVAARAEYIATDEGKAARRRASATYYFRHKDRRSATVTLNNAVRDGRVTKQPCFMCGCEEVEAHHPDYSRPLDVVWLCIPHHKEIHLGE
jgi:hypothetical protein